MDILLINANAEFIPLANRSVHCVVTSPPYWGLRDYQTGSWIGGNANCDHVANKNATKKFGNEDFNSPARYATKTKGYYENVCPKCEAKRIDHQIGLEQSPSDYITRLVIVFREIHRVLRDDGTLWLNIGDSYSGSGKHAGSRSGIQKGNKGTHFVSPASGVVPSGMKQKDVVGIPWMLAFALRADGWYLRSEIIWHKPNPVPESVKDRPTKTHEQIFLLAKSRKYYYDYKAIEEKAKKEWSLDAAWRQQRVQATGGAISGGTGNGTGTHKTRNKRTVWKVPTYSYKKGSKHYATFPPNLIKPCILAGCPEGGIVFDPFVGSGTTIVVARALKRNAIGSDYSADYLWNVASDRLLTNAMKKWTKGSEGSNKSRHTVDHDDLPLFRQGDQDEPVC